jgi:hypothetical protein
MSVIARQSTARIVTVGPILDADGAAVTGAAVGDLKIAKNGGAPASLNGSATLTHRATGHYSLALTTSDLDTVGQAEIIIDKTTDAMPIKVITVIEEAVYDAMFAASATGKLPATLAHTDVSGNLPSNVTQWKGSAPADLADTNKVPVSVQHVANNAITAAAIADNAITAAKVADNAITAAKLADNAITAAKLANDAISADAVAAGAVTKIQAGLATPGDEMTLTDAQVAELVAEIEAELADDATGEAIKQAIIDKLIENLPDLDELTLAAIAQAVWTEAERTLTAATNITSDGGTIAINGSGHIARVVLVDTTTTNTDMRGTDGALLAGNYTTPDNAKISDLHGMTEVVEGVRIWTAAALSNVSIDLGDAEIVVPPESIIGAFLVTISGTVEVNSLVARLNAIQARTNLLGSARVTVSSPVAENGVMEIWRRDDYEGAQALRWRFEDYTGPALSSAVLRFLPTSDYLAGKGTPTVIEGGTAVMDGDDLVVTVDLPGDITAELPTNPPNDLFNHTYTLRGVTTTGSKKRMLASSTLTLRQDLG